MPPSAAFSGAAAAARVSQYRAANRRLEPYGPAAGSIVSGAYPCKPLWTACRESQPSNTIWTTRLWARRFRSSSPTFWPPPFFCRLTTRGTAPAVSDGQHTLKAMATDANGGSTMSSGLTLTTSNGVVSPNPTLIVSHTTLNFTATAAGGSNPSSQTVRITNGGGGTLSWSSSSNASWLTISPPSGRGRQSECVP